VNNVVNKSVKKTEPEPVRYGIRLPGTLAPFVEEQIAKPRYAGKPSNYFRQLVVEHQEKELAL
jgi:hypothetical protein